MVGCRHLLLATALMLTISASGRAATIGVYFDPFGEYTCITNALRVPIDAFIIADDLDCDDDIAGWEASLSFDDGITVFVDKHYGDGIDVGPFPDMRVGIPSPPLAGRERILLAKLTVYATRGGVIRLGPPRRPSPIGSGKLSFTSHSRPGTVIEFTPVVADGGNGQAVIGGNCESAASMQGEDLSSYVIPGMKKFSLTEGSIPASAPRPNYEDKSLSNMEHLLTASDFCFTGFVTTVIYRCYAHERGGVQSLAIIEFDIEDPHWGVYGSRFIVDTKVDRPELCVTYNREFFADFPPGSRFLVFGSNKEGRHICYDTGLFEVVGDTILDPGRRAYPEVARIVDKMTEGRDLMRQASEAECIVLCTVENIVKVGHRKAEASITVLDLLKGTVPTGHMTVHLYHSDTSDIDTGYAMAPILDEATDYLLFLNSSKADGYVATAGICSSYEISGENLLTHAGEFWGPYALAKRLITGNK